MESKMRWALVFSFAGLILAFIGYVDGWQRSVIFQQLSISYPGLMIYLPLIILVGAFLISATMTQRHGPPRVFEYLLICCFVACGALAIVPVVWYFDFKLYFEENYLLFGWYLSLIAGLLVFMSSLLIWPIGINGYNVERIGSRKISVVVIEVIASILILAGFVLTWGAVYSFNTMISGAVPNHIDSFTGYELAKGTILAHSNFSWPYLFLVPISLIPHILMIINPFHFKSSKKKYIYRTSMALNIFSIIAIIFFQFDFPLRGNFTDVRYETEIGLGWYLCLIGLIVIFLFEMWNYIKFLEIEKTKYNT